MEENRENSCREATSHEDYKLLGRLKHIWLSTHSHTQTDTLNTAGLSLLRHEPDKDSDSAGSERGMGEKKKGDDKAAAK